MAEMTVAEAIRILNKSADKALLLEGSQYKEEAFIAFRQIAALIEQLAQEIAKKDKMLKIAVQQLFDDGICPAGGYECNDGPVGHSGCIKCWLAWLEKEAQGEVASDKQTT